MRFSPRALLRQFPRHVSVSPARLAGGLLLLATLGAGGCAQQPQQVAAAAGHGKEYFPSSVYGAASRRVVADGQPIPRGGGQYLVGRPYTVAGQTYYPSERKISQTGNASWYGDAFHGRLTANGEVYDRDGFTAAHPTMPLPSYARVTNLRNNSSMIVRVNDRGPYASNRVMDVSRRVAEALDFKRYGTAKIKVEYVGRASLAGSDDARLFATLRSNGPAQWQGETTMVASATAPTRVASIAPYIPEAQRSPDPMSAPRVTPENEERAEETVRHEPRVRRDAERAGHDLRDERMAKSESLRHGHEAVEPPMRSAKAGLMKFTIAKSAVRTAVEPPIRPSRMAILPPARPTGLGAHQKDAHGTTKSIIPLRMARFRDD